MIFAALRKVLILGSDLQLCHSLELRLKNVEVDVSFSDSLAVGVHSVMNQRYSLVIIEADQIGEKDLELVHVMQEDYITPILAIISPTGNEKRANLLRAGVAVYLEKPLDLDLCIAQVEALLRLYIEPENPDWGRTLTFGTELVIDPLYHQVLVDGTDVELTRTEFDLLYCLAQHPGQVWSRGQLYSYLWNEEFGESGENSIRAHIGNLNRKLAAVRKSYIHNVRGVGYRFVSPP